MAAAATTGIHQRAAPARTAELRIGALISVTSISDMRYEGFLDEINPHSLGLQYGIHFSHSLLCFYNVALVILSSLFCGLIGLILSCF